MRIKLSDKYVSEREEICNELINILELDTEGCFLLSNLDVDVEKQNKILDMKDKIINSVIVIFIGCIVKTQQNFMLFQKIY